MKFYSVSKKLIISVKNFYFVLFFHIFSKCNKQDIFMGWGRKKSGLRAQELAQKYNAKFMLLEDGFIRSLNLGVENAPSFSLVFDDIGIYYDATKSSRLENLLNTYELNQDELNNAKRAIELLKKIKLVNIIII